MEAYQQQALLKLPLLIRHNLIGRLLPMQEWIKQ